MGLLISSYQLEIRLSSHSVDELEFEAVAHLEADLSRAMPYLNAVLPQARFSPQAPALTWRYEGHKVGIWADRIAVDHIHHHDEVQELMERLVAMVNDVWERRAEIEPRLEAREFRQPLEIYRLLPQTNCKLCGVSTCYSFALQLAAGQTDLAKCTPLFDETQYDASRIQLEAILSRKFPPS
jgi:ArsR family metal-binding transcriptional regulator